MTIEFSKEAEADLVEAIRSVVERNSRAAAKLAARVLAIVEKLGAGTLEGPELQLSTGERVRSWPVPPFRIYYKRQQDPLLILRVYHHAR